MNTELQTMAYNRILVNNSMETKTNISDNVWLII